MNPTALKSLATVAGVSLLSTLAASAAVYTNNFNSYAPGTTDLLDGTIINAVHPGLASVQGGGLQLTASGTGSQNAVFKISGATLTNASLGWTASFDVTLSDTLDGLQPADGFTLSWGAIPMDASLTGAAGGAEHGWTDGVSHVSFEVDTWQNGGPGDNGLRIGSGGTLGHQHHAQQVGNIFNEGSSLTGSVIVSWDPINGASMSTSDFLTNVTFTNIAIPGFTGLDSHTFAFTSRTGGAHEQVVIDNLTITTVPEASSALLAGAAGLGLMMVRRRRK